MTSNEVRYQLEAIASTKDFEYESGILTKTWSCLGGSLESVEPILRFMEDHPEVEYGVPGPLVHFMERSYIKGGSEKQKYKEMVVASIRRKPTPHTVWLLNRLANGANNDAQKRQLIAIMADAKSNPNSDEYTRERIDNYLDWQSRQH